MYQLVLSLILGLTSYWFTVFIDTCFNTGNILDWYYLFILNKINPKYPKWAKVLGMCPICFGFWISLGLFLLYQRHFNLNIIMFIPYISICEYKLIKKFIDNN